MNKSLFFGLLVFLFACVPLECRSAITRHFICADLSADKVCMVDQEGHVTWSYDAPGVHDVWMLKDNRVLFNTKHGASMVSIDKRVLWEYKAKAPTEVFSVQPLAEDSILVGQGGETPMMLEFNHDGRLVRHIVIPTTESNPHTQIRLCRKTKEDTYLVSYISEQKVAELDSTGAVIREFSVPGQAFLSVRLDNGNTLVSCGDGNRLVELDTQGKQVWQMLDHDLPNLPLRFIAGFHCLANGNIVVSNWGGHGHMGQQPHFFEITRDKKIVWEFFDNTIVKAPSHIQVLDEKIDTNHPFIR
jgi:hypothetical protein